MTIKTITYKKIFPIASYVNESIGVEIQVNEGESPDELFKEAKALVDKWGKDSITGYVRGWDEQPQLIQTPSTGTISHIQVEKEDRIRVLASDIESCTDIKILESYKLLVRAAPDLQATYDNKLATLSK